MKTGVFKVTQEALDLERRLRSMNRILVVSKVTLLATLLAALANTLYAVHGLTLGVGVTAGFVVLLVGGLSRVLALMAVLAVVGVMGLGSLSPSGVTHVDVAFATSGLLIGSAICWIWAVSGGLSSQRDELFSQLNALSHPLPAERLVQRY